MNLTSQHSKKSLFQLLVNQLDIFRVSFVCLFLFSVSILFAEGTKQVSPTENDWVILMLRAGTSGQAFAGYGSAGTDRALNIIVLDDTEEVYIGLSRLGAGDHHGISDSPYEFRIVDSIGNVVHGPFTVNPSNLNGDNYNDIVAGPDLGSGVGYDVSNPIFHFSPSYTGTFNVEFKMTSPLSNIGFFNEGIIWWDFAVANASGTLMPGRLYSKGWKFRTTCDTCTDIFEQPFKGKIYVLTDDGFVHQLDFINSGFRGLTFDLAFNRTGPGTTGDHITDRKSVNGINAINPKFEIFLNDPDPLIYVEPQIGAVLAGPDFTNPGQCDTLNTFCFEVEISQPGMVEMILDLHGHDSLYTPGTADLVLFREDVSTTGLAEICIDWDGIDGLGNPVDLNSSVPALFGYSQGEIHFMVYDVEYNNPGFEIKVVHPQSASSFSNIYYDDSGLAQDDNDANLDFDNDPATGTNPMLEELNGCATPCHVWNRYTNTQNRGYGESNTINSWWQGNLQVIDLNFVGFCAQDRLIAEKTVLEVNNALSGTKGHFDVTFEILIQNDGTTTFDNILVTDDPASNFGNAFIGMVSNPQITSIAGTPVLPTVGSLPNNLTGGTDGELKPGEAIKIEFTIELNPSSSGSISVLSNQAGIRVRNEFGNTILGLSDDPGDPTSDTDPTLVFFPKIGLAKRITTLPAPAAVSGQLNHFDVSYEFVLENLGDIQLTDISLIDDLRSQFGAGFIGIVGTPSIAPSSTASTLGSINSNYVGTPVDAEILSKTAVLNPGERLIVHLTAEVAPQAVGVIKNTDGNLTNQAIAAGNFGTSTITDLSDEGVNASDNENFAGTNPGTPGDTGGTDDLTLFIPPVTNEICNNGSDDDGDGLIDCADSDCIEQIMISGDCENMMVDNSIPSWTYQWYLNGNPIAGATASTYQNIGQVNKGIFTVEVTNGNGCPVISNEISCCDPTEMIIQQK